MCALVTGVQTCALPISGNFGANDDTLRALAALGFRFDSSFNAAWAGRGCAITLDPGNMGMRFHHGMCEVPVSGLMDGPGSFRPAQLCAMPKEEMRRSEAHTSDLQSLMRTSYADFCLKKKMT